MQNSDTSILIVDDAKFSSTVIARTLKAGGYNNIRNVASAVDALKVMGEIPPSIIIADWLMPEMDGLQLTREIRAHDEAENRYTYIIMLTARDGIDALKHAFEEGVDDFVNKSAMQTQLLPRVLAADRLVNNQNKMLRENQQLLTAYRELEGSSSVDPLTGLANSRHAMEQLALTLQHSESRNDATCLILVEIADWQRILSQYPPHICDELLIGISRRIKGLMRPLDLVAHFDGPLFAVVAHQPDIEQINAKTYKRLLDALNLRAFKTSTGFLSLRAFISISAAHVDTGIPDPEHLLVQAQANLEKAKTENAIQVQHYQQP